MELPAYRMPRIRDLALKLWERSDYLFLGKAQWRNPGPYGDHVVHIHLPIPAYGGSGSSD